MRRSMRVTRFYSGRGPLLWCGRCRGASRALAALVLGAGLACRAEKTRGGGARADRLRRILGCGGTHEARGRSRATGDLDRPRRPRLGAASTASPPTAACPTGSASPPRGTRRSSRASCPLLSPILWTTQATGVPPDVHRVLDFQEVDPTSGRKVPISGNSRAVPAVWNLASAAGRKVGVVGWWASHPAEEVNGFFVSDHASPILFDALPLDGVDLPGVASAGVAQVSARDGRVTAEDLVPFLEMPAAEIAAALGEGAGMENPVVALSRILARDARDAAHRARPLRPQPPGPDGRLLRGHGRGRATSLRPTRRRARPAPPSRDEDVARYERVVATYYGVDRPYPRTVDAPGGGRRRDARRHVGPRLQVGRRPALRLRVRQLEHGGVLAPPGGGFRGLGHRASRRPRRARRPAVSILDVAPTILGLLGLPADREDAGGPGSRGLSRNHDARRARRRRRISSCGASRPRRRRPRSRASTRRSSWRSGTCRPARRSRLRPREASKPGMTEGAWNNLGVYLRENRKDFPAAQAAFEKSLALRPDYYSPMFNLAVLYRAKGDTARAQEWFFALARRGQGRSGRRRSRAGRTSTRRTASARPRRRCSIGRAKQYPENEAIARERALFLHRGKDCRGAAGGADALRGDDDGSRDAERPRALRDVPRATARRSSGC